MISTSIFVEQICTEKHIYSLLRVCDKTVERTVIFSFFIPESFFSFSAENETYMCNLIPIYIVLYLFYVINIRFIY